MNKFVKKVVFVSVILISILSIIIKANFDLQENIYVVSESEKSSDFNEVNEGDTSIDVETYSEVKNEFNENEISKKQVTIYISGEVKIPGVVTLDSDKRLSDGIDEVGGFTSDADLNSINLAMKIEDEKHYIIPKIGEGIQLNNQINNSDTNVVSNKEDKLININNAEIEELDTLPGVGEATANKIISYREESGAFNTIEEIKNVNGIGDKKFEEIKELIRVK